MKIAWRGHRPLVSRRVWLALCVAVLASLLVAFSVLSLALWIDNEEAGANSFTIGTLDTPSGLSAVGLGVDIDLAWTATPDVWAAGYEIHRGTTMGGPYSLHDSVVGQSTTSYSDLGANGPTYYYVVKAYYQNWISTDSNEANWIPRTWSDTFAAVAFNGSEGNQPWNEDWQEIGESDGPTTGDLQISNSNCATSECLQFLNNGTAVGVERSADTSGATILTLEYSYRRSGNGSQQSMDVSVSTDGVSWTVVQTIVLDSVETAHVSVSHDISAHVSSTTWIRIQGPATSTNRLIRFDDVLITSTG
jgi:hypothetical protein